jgi:hypothetical protein
MFIPVTIIDLTQQDGKPYYYERRGVVPGSCIKTIVELQDDDADEYGANYENGARSVIELADGELLYVKDNIEYFVQ